MLERLQKTGHSSSPPLLMLVMGKETGVQNGKESAQGCTAMSMAKPSSEARLHRITGSRGHEDGTASTPKDSVRLPCITRPAPHLYSSPCCWLCS